MRCQQTYNRRASTRRRSCEKYSSKNRRIKTKIYYKTKKTTKNVKKPISILLFSYFGSFFASQFLVKLQSF